MALGSHWLGAFAASREARSQLLDVARRHEGGEFLPSGIFRMAMEFKAPRSSCHLQVTGWQIL
jgi:hypothetical protein